jgi:hypothetical protein
MRAHFGLPSITGTLQPVRCTLYAEKHCNTYECLTRLACTVPIQGKTQSIGGRLLK